VLGSAESEMVRLISGKIIFLQNSYLYDHDTSTLQTDGQADRQLALAIPRFARLRAIKMLFVFSGISASMQWFCFVHSTQ